MLRRFLVNYYERHQHPANQLLHLIGLPVTFVVPVILLVEGRYLLAALSFVAGYLLQFAGHAIEGNDAGEVILVKKLLGKPYVAVVPRSK
ncbi:MAG: DUF962 domain-containing protein [Maioricimonas sp. JB049]